MTQHRLARRPRPRRKKRRSSVRFLMTLLLTTGMVATGGFGAFPQNPITQAFQEEIGQNFPPGFLNPINSYLESLSAPTIQPQPDSNPDPIFDPIGFLFDSTPVSFPITETIMALTGTAQASTSTAQTATLIATSSGTTTLLPTGTGTSTATGTGTSTLPPTLPVVIVYPTATRTLQPPPPDTDTPIATATATTTATATFTPTNTPTSSSTPVPGDFIVSNVMLNGAATTSIYVAPGATFTVGYDFQVWAPDTCPGCIIQLVTGMGNGGVGTNTCAYDGTPGVSPGVTAPASQTLTAPVTAGVYYIIIEYNEQLSCANAISAYTGSSGFATPQAIGTIVVNASAINVFSGGGITTGALGGRAGADAVCVANKPGAILNPNVRALISISDTDSISTMPGTYGIPTNIPLVYFGGNVVASDWADLLDGVIYNSLASSGFPNTGWWSGSENNFGGAIPTTANCFGFTSNAASDFGNIGNAGSTGPGWMYNSNTRCNSLYALVCIASP